MTSRSDKTTSRRPRTVSGMALPARCRFRSRFQVWLDSVVTPQRLICASLLAAVAVAGLVSSTEGAQPEVRVSIPRHAMVVRRPLPPGMKAAEVPKWVPIRQPSGRTELEPWISVDVARARSAAIREELLQAAKPGSGQAADTVNYPELVRVAPDVAVSASAIPDAAGLGSAGQPPDMTAASDPGF